MSSHHIVREKQEPALLVLGLLAFSYELLGQLLEWSPTLIATPDTAVQLHNNQVKIDWLVANTPIDELQLDVKLIPVINNNYLQTVLSQLISKDYRAVNIITDHYSADDYQSYANQIDLVIYCESEKIYPIKSGFSKWKPAGDAIRIVSQPEAFSSTGLKYVGDSSYETERDGFFSITFSGDWLFIAEAL